MSDVQHGAASGQGPARQFLDAYEREHAISERVLRAYPPEQAEFTPHERARPARELAWTLVLGERMMTLAARGEEVMGHGFVAAPEGWAAVLDAFASQHGELTRALRDAGPDGLAGTVRFMTGPKQPGDFPTTGFLWFLLHDQIHHRGQLSVYLRLTGAPVPSIYGPSADEPWM